MTIDHIPADNITVDEYLSQRDYWLDETTWTLVPIDSLSPQRRAYAARALVRNATALISLTENERNGNRNLAGVMELVNRNPKEWVVASPLYGALYRDERDNVAVGSVPFRSAPE
jgi:hypothetical protein